MAALSDQSPEEALSQRGFFFRITAESSSRKAHLSAEQIGEPRKGFFHLLRGAHLGSVRVGFENVASVLWSEATEYPQRVRRDFK